jgi:hypothetical protein
MKHWLRLAAMLALYLGMQITALADKGVYRDLVCRDNDPFVFCTQGCKGQDKNWTPIKPIAGSWRAERGYCPYPTTGKCCFGYVCFRPWTQTAVAAVYQYMDICPAAEQEGDWTGSERPESVPYDH